MKPARARELARASSLGLLFSLGSAWAQSESAPAPALGTAPPAAPASSPTKPQEAAAAPASAEGAASAKPSASPKEPAPSPAAAAPANPAPAPSSSAPASASPAPAAGAPAATATPSPAVIRVEKAGSNKLFRITEGMLVEGQRQKPNAFYVLQRASAAYDWESLDESFLQRIIKATEKPPF